MNKVINININGQVFHIDEEAFEVLNRYLEALKRHFKTSEGGEEILADIESRIAEMLNERLGNRSEVVSMTNVREVIAAMGQPEDMEDPEAQPKSKNYNFEFYAGKRMYRDTDNKILGGVCSGISNYLNIDPVWIRLLFVAVFFGFGTGLLIYIILWVILPPARTSAEKLEMRGERVNISNIEKTVKENLEGLKERFGEEFKHFESKEFRNKTNTFFEGLADGLGTAFKSVFYVFSRFFSFIIIAICICVIIGIVSAVLGAIGLTTFMVPSVVYDFFDNSTQGSTVLILLFIVLGLPFVSLMFRATRYLAGYKRRSRFMSALIGSIWIIAFIALMVLGFGGVSNFSRSYSYKTTDVLKKPAHDTLYLAVNDNGPGSHNYHGDGMIELHRVWNHTKTMGDNNDMGMVDLDISRSDDKNISIEKYYSSRGKTSKDAHELAEGIQYSYFQRDSLITFDEGFKIPQGSHWRGQNVSLQLRVPDGTVVVMKNGMEEIIYDIDNNIDMFDADMIGYKWLMKRDGLNCLDCGSDSTGNKHHHHQGRHKSRSYNYRWGFFPSGS